MSIPLRPLDCGGIGYALAIPRMALPIALALAPYLGAQPNRPGKVAGSLAAGLTRPLTLGKRLSPFPTTMTRRGAANPLPEAPRPLRPLAKMLEGIGFQLAIPFDNIRRPGYIGTYEGGREIILDDGRLLAPFVELKRRSTALGDTTRRSQFSLSSFVKTFGGLAGLNAVRASAVSIRFPNRFVPSEYLTVTDILEDWERLPLACRRALEAPGSFVIVQTLETDSVEYEVQTKAAIDGALRSRIEQEAQGQAALSGAEAEVRFGSEAGYSLVLQGQPMTIAFKPFRLDPPSGE